MKIALIGATGFVGSAILKEALDRGHEVTAIVRDPEKLKPHPKLHSTKGDVSHDDEVAQLVMGHDAVISAFNPGWTNPDIYHQQVRGTRAIIHGVKGAGLKRLLFVGGAGSLEVKPGVQSVDLPEFPAEYKQGALATREALNMLRNEPSLEWSFLSPSADLSPGTRTGKVPSWYGSVAQRCKRNESHLGRGLRRGHDRRGREATIHSPAVYCWLLKGTCHGQEDACRSHRR